MKSTCPAKINLFLKVLRRRSNGFHELESLFAFSDLHDVLEVKKAVTFSLEVSGEFAALLDKRNNLFTKILDFFAKEFAIDKNLEITLQKNIPIGGGLGGGSSNAASFMKILNEIFALNLSKTELQKISLNFGSDIAFFFENQASIIKGRGEIIANFPEFAPLPTLLVNPKIPLLTKEVFEKFNGSFSEEIATEELLKRNVIELTKTLPNDLEEPAISIAPIIGKIIKELENQDAKISKMSGSGASCFGIFADEEAAKEAAQNLQKKFPEFFIKEIKILCKSSSALNH